MEEQNDYSKALERAAKLPRLYLGQEVNTPDGVGIITSLQMLSNGLYIEPERAFVAVWIGTERAFAQRTPFTCQTFHLSEVSPVEPCH